MSINVNISVSIIGLGYIGLPTAAMLTREGIYVHGVDVNPKIVETINRGEIHIIENGLKSMIADAVKRGLLKAYTKPVVSDVYMIVVPTPFRNHQAPDISYVKSATQSVIPLLKQGDLFIIESTSPIGTTEKMVELICRERPDLVDQNGALKFYAAYCPERVLPGNIIFELENNDRVIGGINEDSAQKAYDFYRIFVKNGELFTTNTRTAEMCKITENASRDSQIAFANELSLICDKAGIDVWELIRLANRHPRVNILQPGCGVGGHCIAVDPWFLVRQYTLESRMLATAREVNIHKAFWCAEKIIEESKRFFEQNKHLAKVAIMGLAFKPNIDDLRESPAKFIAQEVSQVLEGQCFFVEPNISEHSEFPITNYEDAIDNADIIVFLVSHDEFKTLTIPKEKRVLDFCGVRNTAAKKEKQISVRIPSILVSENKISENKIPENKVSENRKRIMFVLGTRPEAIKLAPVIRVFCENNYFDTKICLTGQHREMLDQVMKIFNIKADFDLNIMAPNQTLGDVTCKVIKGLDETFKQWKPDTILVQGDTATVLAASIAAFYNRVEVGHIEAGLRTFNKQFPFPEEMNRCVTTQLASYHFAPTKKSKQNLINEGIEPNRIYVTGNTVIDALFQALQYLDDNKSKTQELESKFNFLSPERRTVLVTGHRRENFGEGFLQICNAISELAERDDIQFVYPVHLNPNVREPVNRILCGKKNIFLIEPLDYLSFVYLMRRSDLILTDSGGVQEEAPSLGKPVVVMRDTTERPEAVEAGTVVLAGANKINIVQYISQLLDNTDYYQKMSQSHNPYGDGKASEQILRVLLNENKETEILSVYPLNKRSA
jgi:UDP-N-acetyl-D-mannosaminuronic acid dehydrogenase